MKRLLALIGLLLIAPLLAETLSINQFSGLNTDDSPLTLSNGQTSDSENVVTDLGPGLQGRLGYISFSTQTPRAMWEFPKSDGTRYLIQDVSGRLLADTGAGTFTTLISTVPSDRTVAGSVLGDKFYFADTLNGLKYWDGTSVTVASTTMKVDKLVTWKGRLAAAGKSGSERVILLSKYLDGTSWTAPTNPSDDDATQITVSGALDENIQALFSSFKDLLVWFKKNSFGGIYGSRRGNFSQRTFSDYIGVANPETIRDCDGFLRWLGNNRIVWEFDGATYKKISEQVDFALAAIAQGDSSAKSNTQTTQAQFEAGTQSPTGFGDTTTVPGSVTPATRTFLDTTQADFAAATQTPAGYFDYTTSSGSFTLATSSAIDSFVDTVSTEFAAGSLTNIDTTTVLGSAQLSVTAEALKNNNYGNDVLALETCSGSIPYMYAAFLTTSAYTVTNVKVKLAKQGSPGLGMGWSLASNSGSAPGSVLASGSFTSPALSAIPSYTEVTVDVTDTALSANTSYWFGLRNTGACTEASVYVAWEYDNTFSTGATYTSFRINGASPWFQTYGTDYFTSGNIVSRIFDVGFTTNTWLWDWGTFTANSSLPAGTAITYETQTATSSTGAFNTLTSVTSGNSPTSAVQRFIRYKASLTGTTSATPNLTDVTIAMSTRRRPAGVVTSRAYDFGSIPTIWGILGRTITSVSGGGSSSFQTQASADGSTWDAAVNASTTAQVGSATKRYLRYIWSSTATSRSAYDQLDDVTITSKATGTFTTQAVSVGSQISSWGPVSASLTNNGGSFTIQFATSTDGVTFSSWSTILNNTVPTAPVAPYAATRFLYTLAIATQTPTLDDVTINWTEGSTIKAASAYINQRYWLAVATGSTTNNIVLVFDKLRQWQRYRIPIAATSLYNSRLYIGNSSGTFQAESGYSDNGAAIAAYYNTPTLVPNRLDLYSNFDYLYMTTDPSDSTLGTSFTMNGLSSYSMGSVQMNSNTGFQNFKIPFSAAEAQTGKNISFKWSVSGTSFWRITNGTLYHQPLALPE